MFTIGLLHRKRIASWDFWSMTVSLSSCSTRCDWWRQEWWRQSTAGAWQRHGGKTRRNDDDDDDDTGRASCQRGWVAQTVRRRRRQRRLRRRFHQRCQLHVQWCRTVSVSLFIQLTTVLDLCDNLRRLLGYFPFQFEVEITKVSAVTTAETICHRLVLWIACRPLLQGLTSSNNIIRLFHKNYALFSVLPWLFQLQFQFSEKDIGLRIFSGPTS